MKKRNLFAAAVCLGLILLAAPSFSQPPPQDPPDPPLEPPIDQPFRIDNDLLQSVVARWRILADIALVNSKPDEAIDYQLRIARLTDDASDLWKAADLCLRYERFKAGAPIFEQLIEIAKDKPLYYYGLAICREGLGDNAGRDKALESAAKCTDKPELFQEAATTLFNSQYETTARRAAGDFWPAAAKVASVSDSAWLLLTMLTESYIAHGQYKEAADECRKREEEFRSKNNDKGREEMASLLKRSEALLLYSTGKYEESAALLRELYQRGWGDYEVSAELYRSLKKAGKAEEAVKVLDDEAAPLLDGIQENPSDNMRMNNLAWFYALCGDKVDEGLTLAREAVKGAPDNAAYIDTLAELLYQKGLYKDALENATKALGVWPGARDHFWRQYKKMKEAAEKGRP